MRVHGFRGGSIASLASIALVASIAFAASVGALVLCAGQASASLGEFSLMGSFGELGNIENLAIDESTGDVYAFSPGFIRKFDAEGNPVDFSALGTNAIPANVGGGDETELAVDNSSGPDKGDIYLAGGGVKIFAPDGKALGELTQAPGIPWGETACGVAVDGAGNVYVGVYLPGPSPSVIDEYTPGSGPLTNEDYVASFSGFNEICNVAAAPAGSIYAAAWNGGRSGVYPLVDYDLQSGATKQVLAEAGGTLAVANSPSAELFTVTHKTEIQQYDPTGSLLSTFGTQGAEAEYHTVAIDAKDGRLYAGDYRHGTAEIWQGVVIPQVDTQPASDFDQGGSATLNGSVNPEGLSLEACSFEYGTSTSYGSDAKCVQPTPLSGSSLLAVSSGVSGIPVNHVYHYRLTVTDEHGKNRPGVDRTFMIPVLAAVEDVPPSASLITRDSAQLSGTIDPEQVDASYYFEYGTTESYGNVTPTLHTGVSASDTPVVQSVRELLPETTYHYRLVANNVAGRNVGADHTFTTGAATPPLAVTGGASSVAQNVATIAGAVSTNGLPTSYGFEIGTSTDYGPRTGLGTVGAGLSDYPVSLSLTGLLPGTTYHYRLTATNVDGTSYGVDQTFTTGVFASTYAEPPAPLPFVSIPAIAFPVESKSIVPKGKAKRKAKKPSKKAKHGRKKRAKRKKKK